MHRLYKDILSAMLSIYKEHRSLTNSRIALKDDELTVLHLCSEGKSYAEISKALFIGERTLYSRLNSNFERLGVSNKMQVVSTAIINGLL